MSKAEDAYSDIEYGTIQTGKSKSFCRKLTFRITFGAFKVGIVACLILFVVLPLIYRYSYGFQRSIVFLNFVNVPATADYARPDRYGLTGSRNFYITKDDIKLGTWQILPSDLKNVSDTTDGYFDEILDDGRDVVIYNHGNGGCRLTSHRIETYKLLRQYFHVIAYDYRSYGDSSNQNPSESALVEDILIVYEWVRNRTKNNIFIWGHSLGTSLSSHALLKIQNLNYSPPIGVILESPFNNMKDEISEFPLARFFKFLPWFHFTIVNPMSANFKFETDKYICSVNLPIMILHAEDDRVVPFNLGLKLYKKAVACRRPSQGAVNFHPFSGEHKLGHKYICRAIDLPEKIRDFVESAKDFRHIGRN